MADFFDVQQHSTFMRRWTGMVLQKGLLPKMLCCGVCCFGVLLMIILLPLSIKQVTHSEMALTWHTVSHDLDTEILTEGLHVLAPDSELKVFNNKLITRKMDVRCLSADGLRTTLTLSIQFLIQRDDLVNLLLDFGDESAFLRSIDVQVQNQAKDICAQIEGEELFAARASLDKTLLDTLQATLTNTPSRVTLSFVQLKNMAIQPRFARAIQEKELAQERIDVARNGRKQALVQENTAMLQAIEDVQIKLVQARADADAVLFKANQFAQARASVWQERTQEIQNGMSNLLLDAEGYLNNYLQPVLEARTLSSSLQVCLQRCLPGQDCWVCWVQDKHAASGLSLLPTPQGSFVSRS